MGKVFKFVVMVALVVAVAVLAPELAPFIASTLGVSATVATAIATALLTAISGLISQALARVPSSKPAPINFRQSIGNSWIVIGKRRVGGQLIFYHPKKVTAYGGAMEKGHYRYFVFAAAGHRCKGVTGWMLHDKAVTVDGNGMVVSGDYANAAWLWFARGADDQAANASFVSETDGKWTEDHRGRGVALIYAKFRMTGDVVEAGMPTISAIIEGADEIVDPRTGVAGYTNLATPAVYWWLQLPREEGGFGIEPDEMPPTGLLAAWTNICDEDVPLKAGGTEKRYELDCLIETGAAPSQVLGGMVLCQAGGFCASEGVFLVRPGYWVPPSATLDEADLTGGISIPLLAEPEAVATEVTGTFVDPDENYQQMPVPTRRVTVSAADVRQADADLAHITSHTRGQRIMEIMLRRAQCEKKVNWPMNISGLSVSAMQTVTLGTPRFGLGNYAFVVDDWNISADFGVDLGLREENAEIYEWTAASDERAKSATATPDVPDFIVDETAGTGSSALSQIGWGND